MVGPQGNPGGVVSDETLYNVEMQYHGVVLFSNDRENQDRQVPQHQGDQRDTKCVTITSHYIILVLH